MWLRKGFWLHKFCLLVYKCIHGFAPKYLRDLLTPSVVYSSLRSSNDLFSLSLKMPKTVYGEQAFSYIAPYHWNKLPLGIRMSTSVNIFKKSLKTYLFTRCYEKDSVVIYWSFCIWFYIFLWFVYVLYESSLLNLFLSYNLFTALDEDSNLCFY